MSHPNAKQVFMCNYVTGSAGMTCQHIGTDKQYYVVLIVAHAVAVTCEKDVGVGLCTFNFVLRLSLHLVCLLFGTSSLHLFKKIEFFFIDLYYYN